MYMQPSNQEQSSNIHAHVKANCVSLKIINTPPPAMQFVVCKDRSLILFRVHCVELSFVPMHLHYDCLNSSVSWSWGFNLQSSIFRLLLQNEQEVNGPHLSPEKYCLAKDKLYIIRARWLKYLAIISPLEQSVTPHLNKLKILFNQELMLEALLSKDAVDVVG